MAEEESEIKADNAAESDEKIDYPLDVQYCGGKWNFLHYYCQHFVAIC